MAVNTTASSLCTTASQVLCRRSRGPKSKAQETRYPVPIARRLREWAGILVFGTFSIQCATRQFPFVEKLGNVPSLPILPSPYCPILPTAANATPEFMPNVETTSSIASTKLFAAAVNERGISREHAEDRGGVLSVF